MNLRLMICLLVAMVSMTAARAADGPVNFASQFSGDQVITTKDGTTLKNRIFLDGTKIRSELETQGGKITLIVLPDEQKMYSILDSQKMVMQMPYNAAKYKEQMAAATGVDGDFENLGADTIDGVSCTKYKVTSKDKNIYFIWSDAKKFPVKIQAADGTFTMLWKSYVPGPQPASLFELPSGYQVIQMADLPDMPGVGQ